MAKVYFIVMDRTKARDDEEQMMFHCENALNDISGYLARYMEQRALDINDFRLYIAPSKKVWEEMK